MSKKSVGTIANALLVFADVIDSSMYSAVLGYKEYARRLLDFQRAFKKLGRRYFPEIEDKAVAHSHVEARGDEGTIFIIDTDKEMCEQVLQAIEFLYHLKGILRFGEEESEAEKKAPRRLGIGAGIHCGPVVCVLDKSGHHSVIYGVEGFAINYAKRVESCSRGGKFSKIILSSDAAEILELEPILLSNFRSKMKGIGDDVEVFEVESGLFDHILIDNDDAADEVLISNIMNFVENPNRIDSNWIKAFAISVLECLINKTKVVAEKERYRKYQLKLAWNRTNEIDPILLYLRSKEYRESEDYTQELKYLKQILDRHPSFVHARLMMIKSCWALSARKPEIAEVIYARDMAQEFLEHFPEFISAKEKVELRNIIDNLSTRDKPKKKSKKKKR